MVLNKLPNGIFVIRFAQSTVAVKVWRPGYDTNRCHAFDLFKLSFIVATLDRVTYLLPSRFLILVFSRLKFYPKRVVRSAALYTCVGA